MHKDLEAYKNFIPINTIVAWKKIDTLLPQHTTLIGGTALTIYLKHRVSRDLDFYSTQTFDSDVILENIQCKYNFEVFQKGDGMLTGWLDETKIEIFGGGNQKIVERGIFLAGLKISSIPDLLAMKLKTINDRGTWRDYFDIFTIDTKTQYSIEDGLEFFRQRFGDDNLNNYMNSIPVALGYTDDVLDDFGITDEMKETTIEHFSKRIASIVHVAQGIIENQV
jgi:hypothetical protein